MWYCELSPHSRQRWSEGWGCQQKPPLTATSSLGTGVTFLFAVWSLPLCYLNDDSSAFVSCFNPTHYSAYTKNLLSQLCINSSYKLLFSALLINADHPMAGQNREPGRTSTNQRKERRREEDPDSMEDGGFGAMGKWSGRDDRNRLEVQRARPIAIRKHRGMGLKAAKFTEVDCLFKQRLGFLCDYWLIVQGKEMQPLD